MNPITYNAYNNSTAAAYLQADQQIRNNASSDQFLNNATKCLAILRADNAELKRKIQVLSQNQEEDKRLINDFQQQRDDLQQLAYDTRAQFHNICQTIQGQIQTLSGENHLLQHQITELQSQHSNDVQLLETISQERQRILESRDQLNASLSSQNEKITSLSLHVEELKFRAALLEAKKHLLEMKKGKFVGFFGYFSPTAILSEWGISLLSNEKFSLRRAFEDVPTNAALMTDFYQRDESWKGNEREKWNFFQRKIIEDISTLELHPTQQDLQYGAKVATYLASIHLDKHLDYCQQFLQDSLPCIKYCIDPKTSYPYLQMESDRSF